MLPLISSIKWEQWCGGGVLPCGLPYGELAASSAKHVWNFYSHHKLAELRGVRPRDKIYKKGLSGLVK